MSRTNIIITILPSYYIPKNLQNTFSKTALKYYKEFRSVRTEAIRWVKITIYSGMKIKVETTVKEIDKQLLDFITIDVLNIE